MPREIDRELAYEINMSGASPVADLTQCGITEEAVQKMTSKRHQGQGADLAPEEQRDGRYSFDLGAIIVGIISIAFVVLALYVGSLFH
jgi:hypothetical protein